MQSAHWKRMPRTVVVPAVFALGAMTAMGLRGNAGVQKTPVQPTPQALELQTAFEQVADHMRPSVVFIKSRQSARTSNTGGDGDDSPFNFQFPGVPNGRSPRMNPMNPLTPRRAYASGSGVIVRGDGYILTNDHVVEGADKVTVRLQDGREFIGKVSRDFKSDLALIKIDATGLPAAELADSDKAHIGQWAIAYGSPFGLNDTMTVGVISSLHRNQSIGAGSDARYYSSLIQTDASINPGNSGGPLVDIYGRVIGINVAIESPSGGNVGIGFAIPANTAKYVMEQLATKGSVTRGYLGLAPKTLEYDEEQRYGVTKGALVMSVQDSTPASRAGFQVEDVITRFNSKDVATEADLRDLISRTAPGTTIPVVVRRGGVERTLNVTIGSPTDQAVAAKDTPEKAVAAKAKLGIRVGDANDPEVRDQLKLKDDVKTGAVVVEVVPGTPAADAGLMAGDVITRLDSKNVSTADQLTEVAKNLKSGVTVAAVVRRGNQTLLAQIDLD